MANKNLGELYFTLGAKVEGFLTNLEKSERAFQRTASRMKSMGRTMSVAVTAPLVALGVSSLKAQARMEGLQGGLEAVMGSSEAARKELSALREVAKLPGLSFAEAVQGSVSLQAAGLSANKARRALQAFGNAIATVGGNADTLKNVNLQLTQLAGATSGYGADLRSIRQAVPQVGTALQNAFGTQRSEEIQKLGVTGAEVVDVIIAELERLPKVTGGLAGAFENFGDSINQSLTIVGRNINETFDVTGILNNLGGQIVGLAEKFDMLPKSVKAAALGVGVFASALGPALLGIGQMIAYLPFVIKGLNTLTTAFTVNAAATARAALAFSTAVASIAAIAAVLGYVGANWKSFKKTITAIGLQFKISFLQAKKAVLDAQIAIAEFFGNDKKVERLKKAYKGATDEMIRSSQNLFGAIKGIEFKSFGETVEFYEEKLRGLGVTSSMTEDEVTKLAKKLSNLGGQFNAPEIDTGDVFAGTVGIQPLEYDYEAADQEREKFVDDNLQALSNAFTGVTVPIQFQMNPGDAGAPYPLPYDPITDQDGNVTGLSYGSEDEQENAQAFNEKLATGQRILGDMRNIFQAITAEDPFAALGQALIGLIQRLIEAVVLAGILFVLTGGGSAAGGGKSGAKTFGDILKGILGFAEGGVVTGPTLGLVGEKVGSRGEAIIPLEKLPGLVNKMGPMNGGGVPLDGRLVAEVSGDKLLFVYDRASQNQNRFK